MESKSEINIVSKASGICESSITVKGENFSAQTEYLGPKTGTIVTHVYREGEIIFSKKKKCSDDMVKKMESKKYCNEQLKTAHRSAIDEYLRQFAEQGISSDEYLSQIKSGLRADNRKEALAVAQEAMDKYPFETLFQSYCGYLLVCVNRDQQGITYCRNAISAIERLPRDRKKALMPLFCLHLGRAYMLTDRKKEAVTAFRKGLEFDRKDWEINRELKKLGIRGSPPIPFLSRSNPINKYLGKLLYRKSGKTSE